jgi:hypothetical protein
MMNHVAGEAIGKTEIRYRLTLLQRALPVFAGLWVLLAVMALVASRTAYPLRAAEIRDFIGSIFVMTGSLVCFTREEGVTLRPGEMVVHKTRKRVIDWHSIADITIERELVYRVVIIRDAGGRRIRLPAPESYLDHGFDEKVRIIQSCWLGRHDWPVPSQNSMQVP